MSGHAHNPGKLKQSNKKHKGNANSKRIQKKLAGGKVAGGGGGVAKAVASNAMQTGSGRASGKKLKGSVKGGANPVTTKADRVNQQVQARRSKLQGAQLGRRLGTSHGPPKIVALVPLTDIVTSAEMLALLSEENTNISGVSSRKRDETSNISYTHYSNFKSNCIYLEARNRSSLEYLDICKIADMVVFGTRDSVDESINMVDDIGTETLTLVRSMGIPEICCMLMTTEGIDTSSMVSMDQGSGAAVLEERVAKKDKEVRANLTKFLESQLSPALKMFDLRYIYEAGAIGTVGHNQLINLIRHIANCSQKPLVFLGSRSYVLSEHMDMEALPTPSPSGKKMIAVRGYLRGKPLYVDSLMTVSGAGACRIVRIEQANDPFNRHPEIGVSSPAQFINANEANQESLSIEAIPDPLMGEQTWPTEDDIALATSSTASARDRLVNTKSLPTGMSSYQADWLIDEDGRWTGDDGDEKTGIETGADDGNDELDDMMYDGASEVDASDGRRRVHFGEGVKMGGGSSSGARAAEREALLEDLEFPDEVETPTGVSCRQRFSRYRCLQSFRSSYWNPMENLPESYSRIFHIENLPGIVKKNQDELNTIEKNFSKIDEDVLNADGAIKPGQYITVYLECEDNVFASFNSVKANVGYCCSYSLNKYENKMSILHFTINRDKYYDGIIKCKDELYFHTGCRTFNAKPIFSEPNLNSDKHKMDRFLHEDRFTVASCIGPVTYTPSPVIVLKRVEYTADDGSIEVKMELVATGTLTSVDPNRIVLKKVILTGAPLRCKKKSAVIKHMFHDPLDVTYYKPAELVTKLGLRGVIRESVGTHGIFKATFDNIIKQNDTVMLIMHKRCFPKLPDGGIVIR